MRWPRRTRRRIAEAAFIPFVRVRSWLGGNIYCVTCGRVEATDCSVDSGVGFLRARGVVVRQRRAAAALSVSSAA